MHNLVWIVTTIVLSGCFKKQNIRNNDFLVEGKLAIIQQEKAVTANFSLNRQPQNYQVTLSGPLGSHFTQISANHGTVVLITAQGEHIKAQSAEQLIKNELGVYLPVSGLLYWIKGLPAPTGKFKRLLGDNAQLAGLNQDGWHIHYQEYFSSGLPQRVLLEGHNTKIKILVHKWLGR